VGKGRGAVGVDGESTGKHSKRGVSQTGWGAEGTPWHDLVGCRDWHVRRILGEKSHSGGRRSVGGTRALISARDRFGKKGGRGQGRRRGRPG